QSRLGLHDARAEPAAAVSPGQPGAYESARDAHRAAAVERARQLGQPARAGVDHEARIRTILRYHAVAILTRKDSMNILVTGGAGFIGSHMAKRHLADGH